MVHKKDYLLKVRSYMLLHGWPPLLLRFQCALYRLQEQVTPVYYDFSSYSVQTNRGAELYGDGRLSGQFRD